jgi:hypothetical protein
VNQHQLPAIVDEVESIGHPAYTHIQFGSHLKSWRPRFQHHDTAAVNAVEAAFEFLTKKTTFTNGLSKKTTCKKNCQKRPLLVAACLAN